MTKVTNIYIDTTGFTDEQYERANEAMDELKSNDAIGWPVGDRRPNRKKYPVLCIDFEGSRQYQNDIGELNRDEITSRCKPVTLSQLICADLRAKHERSLKLEKYRRVADKIPAKDDGQSIKVGDIMTLEREKEVVSNVASSLLLSQLISTTAYRAITNAIHDYCVANGTQP